MGGSWEGSARALGGGSRSSLYKQTQLPIIRVVCLIFFATRTTQPWLFGEHCGRALPHRLLVGQRVRCSGRDCSLGYAIVMRRTRLVPTHTTTTLWYSVYQVKPLTVRCDILLVTLARARSTDCTPRIRTKGVRFDQIEMLVGVIRLISSYTTAYASRRGRQLILADSIGGCEKVHSTSSLKQK